MSPECVPGFQMFLGEILACSEANQQEIVLLWNGVGLSWNPRVAGVGPAEEADHSAFAMVEEASCP